MTLVGTVTAVGMFFKYTLFSIFAENIAYKLKLKYFRAALEKDSAYYDLQNQNEMASKISKECSAVSRGIGEKVSHVIGGVLAMFIGFFVAFFFCYQFTLLLFAFMPFLMTTTMIMSLAFKRSAMEGMKHYAQSAGYAEQAILAIKVV